jgi:hypothetical protein
MAVGERATGNGQRAAVQTAPTLDFRCACTQTKMDWKRALEGGHGRGATDTSAPGEMSSVVERDGSRCRDGGQYILEGFFSLTWKGVDMHLEGTRAANRRPRPGVALALFWHGVGAQ